MKSFQLSQCKHNETEVLQRILASLKSLLNKENAQFSLHKCPKPSWQGFGPPQNQANAHLILANSSLKKCPKPSGQGSRAPLPYGQCPNAPRVNLRGASLTSLSFSRGWHSHFPQMQSPRLLHNVVTSKNGLENHSVYHLKEININTTAL